MTYLTTISGKVIDLRYIDTQKLCVEDMAYSLSNIHRFNGHAVRNISVAEHSLSVLAIMQIFMNVRCPATLMAGLLHDGHEYLTGDITQPVKQLMGDAWKVEENRIQRVVLQHFGVWTAFQTNAALIHEADMRSLSCEREQLMPANGDVWPCQIKYPSLDWVPCSVGEKLSNGDWRQLFLDNFHILRSGLGDAHQAIPTKS